MARHDIDECAGDDRPGAHEGRLDGRLPLREDRRGAHEGRLDGKTLTGWGARLLAALLIVLLVAGCAPDPLRDPQPVARVQGFVAAFEARDPSAMLSFVEPTLWRRDMGPEVRSYMSYIERIELRDASYELLSNSGQIARVQVRGTLDYVLRDNLASGTREIELIFELVRLEGEWYLQGFALPSMGEPSGG